MRKEDIVKNLKNNWYIPISVGAFLCLQATIKEEDMTKWSLSSCIAIIIWLYVSAQVPSIWECAKKNSLKVHIVSLLTAAGICWCGQENFCKHWNSILINSSKSVSLLGTTELSIISVVSSVVGFVFVYILLLIFWKEMLRIFWETQVLKDIQTIELVIYMILISISVVYMITVFWKTGAFYGPEWCYDLIYTSDSPVLASGNVYLRLLHPENDLRQPLFAIFAMPFAGIPYLLNRLLGGSIRVQVILVNIVQIFMLFFANIILTKIMKLDIRKRICFIILSCCTYTYMLFVLMMEQYIVAYFWVILCLYLISVKQGNSKIALWGAGGTLLTSMIVLPFVSTKGPFTDLKRWFTDTCKYGMEVVLLMLAFGRGDIIFNLATKITAFSNYTGRSLSMTDKVYQYVAYVHNFFMAPNAEAVINRFGHMSWQMKNVSSIDLIGLAILVLAIISAIMHNRKKESWIATAWGFFSVVMLLGLGWGTAENGLILYSLYFGWPLLVLIFLLVEKLEEKLGVKYVVPVFCFSVGFILVIDNIPAIAEMVEFAITYYPI